MLTLNYATQTPVRHVTLNGREYIVAPISILKPGILNGSRGALYYPAMEVYKSTRAWDGMPVVINHPTSNNGTPIAASSPGGLRDKIGFLKEPRQRNDKLVADGWFDVELTKAKEVSIYNALMAGEKIEVSTGLFTDNIAQSGYHDGREYHSVATNYRPDHLAILPHQEGACSLRDGCGVFNKSEPTENVYCPTGSGGGIDPSCKKGGSPGPKTTRKTKKTLKKKLNKSDKAKDALTSQNTPNASLKKKTVKKKSPTIKPDTSESPQDHKMDYSKIQGSEANKKLIEVDKAINKPEILSQLKIPEVMYHLTDASNVESIMKNGLQTGQPRASEEGVIFGTYLAMDKSDFNDQSFGDVKIKNPVVIEVRTKGLNLRLDPEYAADAGAKGEYADEYVQDVNDGMAQVALYSPVSIPKDSIKVHTRNSVQLSNSSKVNNTFCATGKGGGIDPSCKKGGSPGPKTTRKTKKALKNRKTKKAIKKKTPKVDKTSSSASVGISSDKNQSVITTELNESAMSKEIKKTGGAEAIEVSTGKPGYLLKQKTGTYTFYGENGEASKTGLTISEVKSTLKGGTEIKTGGDFVEATYPVKSIIHDKQFTDQLVSESTKLGHEPTSFQLSVADMSTKILGTGLDKVKSVNNDGSVDIVFGTGRQPVFDKFTKDNIIGSRFDEDEGYIVTIPKTKYSSNIDWRPTEMTPEDYYMNQQANNTFCATGKGGGIDPHCGNKGGGAAPTKPKTAAHEGATKGSTNKDVKKAVKKKAPSKTRSKLAQPTTSVTYDENLKQHVTADGKKLPKGFPRPAPKWQDVKVNLDPKADLRVLGKDEKGRRVAIYSENFVMKKAAAKFAKNNELLKKQGEIVNEIKTDLSSKDKNTRENASVAYLVQATGLRPGSTKDTGAKVQAYGATTLKGEHVKVSKEGVTLEFTGKKGVSLSIPVNDEVAAGMLKSRKKSAGDAGNLFETDSSKLLKYVKEKDGGGFRTKDLRTAKGTMTAIDAIKSMPTPKNMAEYKAQVLEVGRRASSALGNTPAIALQSYVNPTVFNNWKLAAMEGEKSNPSPSPTTKKKKTVKKKVKA